MEKTFNIESANVVNAITKLGTFIYNKYKDAEFKKEAELKTIYINYLKHAYENNKDIKSIIHRNPIGLKKIYEPMDIEYTNEANEVIKIEYSEIIPETISKGKIIIQGIGGLGKSLLMQSLFLDLINQVDFIPIIIDLKKYQGEKMIDFIFQSMKNNHFNDITIDNFTNTLESGYYFILLDSFDEINPEYITKATEEINSFSKYYNSNKYVVASRPFDTNVFNGWRNFYEYDLSLLTKNQMESLIRRINTEPEPEFFIKELKRKFNRKTEYLGNPLLLTIMLITYNKFGELPNDYLDFYERAYSVLFYEHDRNKQGYKRQRSTKLTESQFKRVLSYVAARMFVNKQILVSRSDLTEYIEDAIEEFRLTSFSPEDFIEDSVQSLCMIVKEGRDYKFIHKNFQEYFAGKYFSSKPDEFFEKNFIKYIDDNRIDLMYDSTLLSTIYLETPERHDQKIILPLLNKLDLMAFYQFFNQVIRCILIEYDTETSSTTLTTTGSLALSLSDYIKKLYGIDVEKKVIKEIRKYGSATRITKYCQKSPFSKEDLNNILNNMLPQQRHQWYEVYFTLKEGKQIIDERPKKETDKFA
ncbi:TPA: NACHT domain-containing NTPase [Streptococcus suis]